MKTNREEILQSALRLFMSMNYERVSLQMVTEAVGLTKTGIFNYYASKQELFVAVADRYLFNAQDPEKKYAVCDGTLSDFIDKYIRGVAQTMEYIVRIGRVEGDVFNVLLPLTEEDEAKAYCDAIQQACDSFEDEKLAPSVAVGCVMRTNVEESFKNIFSDAEYAMLENKFAIKNAPGYKERLEKGLKNA